MRVLFLCAELAGYFVNCINTLKQTCQAEVKVIHWPVNPNAPFKFELMGVTVSDKSMWDLNSLRKSCQDFNPDVVYVAGWVDKDYLNISKTLRLQGAITIGGLDNPWRGTLRQMIGKVLAPWVVKPYFEYLWVAGLKQYKFAKHLGYENHRILKGVYAADVEKFSRKERTVFSKVLLFVGRFEPEKGVRLLFETFLSLTDQERNGWKLRMIGNGSLRQRIKSTASIIVEDFKQPDTLAESTLEVGGFILPSCNEPWGVVVQEFAAAGLPLLLSDAVNSGELFLRSGENGYVFKANNPESLKTTLVSFFQLDQNRLCVMGARSFDLAHSHTSHHWVKQLLSEVSNHNTIPGQ